MKRITVAKGDGIGPEILDATLRILKAAGAQIEIDEIEIGEEVYKADHTSGIAPESWDSIRQNKVFLKAPITTPQGGVYKSLNVTTRKALGLFANVRPCRSLHPFVSTKHPDMDVVIIREHEEDLYAGIEHQQTDEVVQCLKLISRPGCEKIIRYAFEYARHHGRKKVTCFTKDNIMKQTDGLFHKVFDEIEAEYTDIENEHWIVDIGNAKLADTPEIFDVIVMPNLYGDILSDVSAQIAGSVGLAGSANIGETVAMFEAIHGSAPRRAGQDMANPSGLLQGALMMLHHIGESEAAVKIQNAWLKTMEDGVHTYDVYKEGISIQKVGTRAFAEAVIERLGQKPTKLKSEENIRRGALVPPAVKRRTPAKKELVGVDLFVDRRDVSADECGALLQRINTDSAELTMITNRGIKVWPNGFDETFWTDHWRCRFKPKNSVQMTREIIVELMDRAVKEGIEVIKTENLYTFDGVEGFSKGQGQ